MKAVLTALMLLIVAPALAANAEAPNKNVDKSNDAGGESGNSQTEKLNQGQATQK